MDDRPKCRCAERRDAAVRAWEAKRRGDDEMWRKEMAFIKESTIEDAKAARDWLMRRWPNGPDRPPSKEG